MTPPGAIEDDVVFEIPRIPASAGALIFDGAGRLLVLKPTYKSGWTVPGGQMEDNGETPWEACRREVREESGLVIDRGRLVCVDFLRPRPRDRGECAFSSTAALSTTRCSPASCSRRMRSRSTASRKSSRGSSC